MPSSRRSSLSTSSKKIPAWRTVSITKNLAPPTGLSYIFAEPERGSPLSPAVSQLFPTSSRIAAMQESDVEGRSTSSLRRRASMMSTSTNGRREDEQDLRTGREAPQTISQDTSPSTPTPGQSEPSPTESRNLPYEAPTPMNLTPKPEEEQNQLLEQTSAEPSQSSRTSWFGSLSRRKEHHKPTHTNLRQSASSSGLNTNNAPITAAFAVPEKTIVDSGSHPEPAAGVASSPSSPPVPATLPNGIAPLSPPKSPLPSIVSAPQPSPRRSWFSSASTSRPDITSLRQDTTQSLSPSIDEEVPALPSAPVSPLLSPSSMTVHSSPSIATNDNGTGIPSISTLNPSTSRFSLGVPLLGRPKQPLEKVMVTIQSEYSTSTKQTSDSMNEESQRAGNHSATADLSGLHVQQPGNTSEATAEPPAASATIDAEPPVPSQPPPTTTTTTTTTKTTTTTTAETIEPTPSSWWGYIGWGTATQPDTAAPPPISSSSSASASSAPEAEARMTMQETQETPGPAGNGSASNAGNGLIEARKGVSQHASDSTTQRDPASSNVGAAAKQGGGDGAGAHSGGGEAAKEKGGRASAEAQEEDKVTKAKSNIDTIVSAAAGSAPSTDSQPHDSSASTPSSSSAWYTPWRWYGSVTETETTATTTTTTTGLPQDSQPGDEQNRDSVNPPPEGNEGAPQAEPRHTHAGAVKEDANRGQKVESNSDVDANSNPVESSLSTHRSGWASFFSSKSLITKTIAGNPNSNAEAAVVDENGMEVMDVDDGGEEAGGVKREEEPQPQRGRPQKKVRPLDVKVGPNVIAMEKRMDKHDVRLSTTHKAPPQSPSSPTPSTKGSQSSAPLITISDTVKREMIKLLPSDGGGKEPSRKSGGKKSASPSPSMKSTSSAPGAPQAPRPNLVLPTWDDIFLTPPRSMVPPPPASTFSKTVKFVSGILFSGIEKSSAGRGGDGVLSRKGKGKERDFASFGKELPRAWDVMEQQFDPDVLRGCRRVVVIGVHGWFPGAVMRSVIGEPTGTSGKFVNMMVQALEEFQEEHAVKFEKITSIPLEGEGTIDGRVAKLYGNLRANQEWVDDLHAADVIFFATHSQGSIVSTHLLDCLIRDQHIKTSQSVTDSARQPLAPSTSASEKVQRVCCLALCGIHLGPLRYLSSSSLLQPYFQYFESAAARELFEFQNTESEVSKNYVKALRNVLDHGTKMVYVASLNDQVVPIYSGLFTAASHPLILRALYIDGDAYHSSDFLSNLLVLLLRIFNSGISDSGLTVHLSEATAGSLNGVGHSTAYEEISTYALAVKYLFLTNNGSGDPSELTLEPFDASKEQNDYEIPWSLRDVIADERVEHFFSQDIAKLRDAFRDWHPKTSILRDLKRKLQPIQRLPSSVTKL